MSRTTRGRDDRRAYDHRNPRKSITLTLVTALFAIYALMPLVWLVISSTKTQADYVSTFGFAFGNDFALFDKRLREFRAAVQFRRGHHDEASRGVRVADIRNHLLLRGRGEFLRVGQNDNAPFAEKRHGLR